MASEAVLMTRAARIRLVLEKASEAKPVTVTEIARQVGAEYRECFQVVRKMKQVDRKQIAKITPAGNETPVFAYWMKK